MKKLFISQPMRGKTDEEIMTVRKKAIESVENMLEDPVEVIDSFFQGAPDDATPLWYLGKSLELLSQADIVYFADGWQQARGCRIEHECALEYGIDIVYDDDDELNGSYMDFGLALFLLKEGFAMTRQEWEGRELKVVYQKGYPNGIPCNKQTADAWGMNEGEIFKCDPYLQISTEDGSHTMYTPSVKDCLATDWKFAEE